MELNNNINDKKNNQSISYSCGQAQIHVSSYGYIVNASGIAHIIWSIDPLNIDKIIVGLHVNEFANMLSTYHAYPEAYDSFKENVLPYYNQSLKRQEENVSEEKQKGFIKRFKSRFKHKKI